MSAPSGDKCPAMLLAWRNELYFTVAAIMDLKQFLGRPQPLAELRRAQKALCFMKLKAKLLMALRVAGKNIARARRFNKLVSDTKIEVRSTRKVPRTLERYP